MNYCHRCQSHYKKPGTCNCFAEKPAEQPAPPVYVPYPVYPVYPYYPGLAPVYEPYPWWSGDSAASNTTTVSPERMAELEAQGLLTYTGSPGTTWVALPPSDPNEVVGIYGSSATA